ncbi:MAG: STAS domain-containing protein [Pseudomonadales bacterium]|nr:STAS domain-containing protein [Pseudomonadales bacterium]
MSSASILEVSSQQVVLSGTIDVQNAMALKAQGEALIAKLGSQIEFDLSGVSHSGSVGVSLLLAWMRAAAAADKEIVFLNIPSKMFDIARVSGLDDVLPLRAT